METGSATACLKSRVAVDEEEEEDVKCGGRLSSPVDKTTDTTELGLGEVAPVR